MRDCYSKGRAHKWRIVGFLPGEMGFSSLVFIECKRCCQKFTAEVLP